MFSYFFSNSYSSVYLQPHLNTKVSTTLWQTCHTAKQRPTTLSHGTSAPSYRHAAPISRRSHRTLLRSRAWSTNWGPDRTPVNSRIVCSRYNIIPTNWQKKPTNTLKNWDQSLCPHHPQSKGSRRSRRTG